MASYCLQYQVQIPQLVTQGPASLVQTLSQSFISLFFLLYIFIHCGFYRASQVALVVKKKKKTHLSINAGDRRDTGLIPGSGRSPGGGHGNPLQYSCLENLQGQRKPGGQQSTGLQGVGHDRNDLACHLARAFYKPARLQPLGLCSSCPLC